ncbi:MAG: hypothetical protein ACQESE_04520 [Nanobdellota archaeon]
MRLGVSVPGNNHFPELRKTTRFKKITRRERLENKVHNQDVQHYLSSLRMLPQIAHI